MATAPGRLAPGDTWGRPAAWVGHQCKLSVSSEAGRTRFSGVAPGVASTHTKSHVKSEGGMECTRVLPKSRVANRAGLAPAKSDLAAKTNPEGTPSVDTWPVKIGMRCSAPRLSGSRSFAPTEIRGPVFGVGKIIESFHGFCSAEDGPRCCGKRTIDDSFLP